MTAPTPAAKTRKPKTSVTTPADTATTDAPPKPPQGSRPFTRDFNITGDQTAIDAITVHDMNRLRYQRVGGNNQERRAAKHWLDSRGLSLSPINR